MQKTALYAENIQSRFVLYYDVLTSPIPGEHTANQAASQEAASFVCHMHIRADSYNSTNISEIWNQK